MRFSWLAIGLIIILAGVVYANSFPNPFIWDDANLVVLNPYIKDIRFLKDLFTKDLAYGAQFSNFYRPLQSLSFMLNYYLWGLNPFGFHLTNLILHIGCALLVYFIFASIFPHAKHIALITALLFVSHPIHTEAVTYISGRADPQASLFMLLAIFFYIRHSLKAQAKNIFYGMGKYKALSQPLKIAEGHSRRRFSCSLATACCFILALLSKETALILPLLILLYDVSFSKSSFRFRDKVKFHYSLFLLVALAYILLRMTVLNFLARGLFLSNISLNLRLLTSVKTFALYLGLVILPLHLHMERSLPMVGSILDKGVLFSLILFLLLIILIVRSHRYSKVYCFAGMWFVLTLLPVSNIVPLNANMAEHWLYLPSLGLFLAFAFGIDKLIRSQAKVLAIILVVGLLTFYSFLTIQRNYDWKNPESFFKSILAYNPQSVEAYNCLGVLYDEQGKVDLAILEFEQAVKIDPYNFKSYGNLGSALRKKGKYDAAISVYQKALALRPDIPGLYNNLGNVYADKDEYVQAERILNKALDLFPEFALCRVNLGRVYYEMGKTDVAIQKYKEALALEPNLLSAHYNLALAYQKRQDYDLAIEAYKKVVSLAPRNLAAHLNLGTVYNVTGHFDQAIGQYQQILKLDPTFFLAYYNSGVVYFKKGDYPLAKENFLHVLELNPEYKPAREFLQRIKALGD